MKAPAKWRLPTIAIRTLSGGGRALADRRDVLLEQIAQLRRLAVVVLGIRPAVARVQYLARHTGHSVGDVQPEHGVDVCIHAAQVTVEDGTHDGASMGDRHALTDAVRSAHPTGVEHPDLHMVPLDTFDQHVRVAL